MVRRKIKIMRIEDAATRQVTFSKRRGGLLKKAHDLAVLCDAEVGVIVFSSKGKLFKFASPSMERVLERYTNVTENMEAPDNNTSTSNAAIDRLTQFTEKVKTLQSNLIGDDLEHLSLRDLIHLERQIHGSLGRIRTKKEELYVEQLEDIKEKVIEAQRTTIVNSTILEKLVDFGPSEVTAAGQGNSKCHCPTEITQTNVSLSLRAYTSELISEGLPPTKRSIITEDLNKSPATMEE